LEEIRLKTFINTELRTYSNADNVRSIPSIIDGFKDSQRKAVFGLLQNGPSEIKVSQLGAKTCLITHFKQGEDNMSGTIVGLAQNFPGSNNINLFDPIGQFGSIISPEPSAARYIFTKPTPWLRKLIRKDDDAILVPRVEEGYSLEPISYYPILPLWLVNGALGIGTGHAVNILPRDHKKVAQLISKIVSGTKVTQAFIDKCLTPYFNGWTGTIGQTEVAGQWELTGRLEVVNSTKIRITELPVGYDVSKFKSILIGLMDKNKVKDFDANCSEEGFDFIVTVPREVTQSYSVEELYKLFKLSLRKSENVTLWDINGNLNRYTGGVYEALQEFIQYRLSKYAVRKQVQLELMCVDLDWLTARIKFITYWNTKLKNPHKKSKTELSEEFSKVVDGKYVDRLLGLPISSLTMEKIDDLQKQVEDLKTRRDTLEATTIEQLYITDLEDVAK